MADRDSEVTGAHVCRIGNAHRMASPRRLTVASCHADWRSGPLLLLHPARRLTSIAEVDSTSAMPDARGGSATGSNRNARRARWCESRRASPLPSCPPPGKDGHIVSERHARMTGTTRDLHRIDAGGGEQCDPDVLEVVRTKRRESGSLHRRPPRVRPPLFRVKQVVVRGREHVGASAKARHVESKLGDDRWRKCHRPSPGLGLRGPSWSFPPTSTTLLATRSRPR